MRRPARRDLLVFLGFAAISFGYFGWRVLPHPGRALIGTGADPLIFVWSFAWWPHAILHGTNPFVTHALYAPAGANLVWTTSVPALALAFAPVTLLVGPVASYDLAAVLLPALAAWTAYRFCHYLTRSLWASLVGGYLFGFSSLVLAQQLQGHLNLTGVFVLPLLALNLARFVRGELSGRGLALRLGVLLALQFGISTEITLTFTLVLALALLLASVLVSEARPRLRALLGPLAAGYGLAVVISAPLVVYAVLGFPPQGYSGAQESGTDLLNLLVPTQVNAIAGSSFPSVTSHFNEHESAIFLGLPTLVIVALYGWRARGSPWGRVLVGSLLVSVLLAIGAVLRVNGRRVVSLPWALTKQVPGLDNVHTTRFGVYVALASALIVALWTSQARGRIYRRPYALPLLAVVALVPAVWHPLYLSRPAATPAFFSDDLYRTCVSADETLEVFPFGLGGDSMLWQAQAGFRFRLAEGYLSPVVFGARPLLAFDTDPLVHTLDFLGYEARPTMTALLGFAATHGVGRIVSVLGDGYPSERQMRRFGRVERIGGTYVAPACGQPPLTTRALTPAVRSLLAEQHAQVEIGYCFQGSYYLLPAGTYPTGVIEGARTANLVAGSGLQCTHPRGYTRDGFAPSSLGVPAATYPYYVPRAKVVRPGRPRPSVPRARR